jgi:hypothetical protein
MDIQSALFLSLAVFALLEFGLLPRMKNAWSRLPLDKQLKRFGILAILEKVREYSAISALCFLSSAILVFVAVSHFSDSAPAVSAALRRAQQAYSEIKEFKEIWTTWIFFFSFVLLWWAWHRSAKKFARETLKNVRLREYDRLAKLRDEHPDEWKELPATAEMDALQSRIEAVLKQLQNRPDGESASADTAKQLAYVQKLSAVWTLMDFDRRLRVPWNTEAVQGHGTFSRLKRLAASRGFVSDMKGFSKLLSYASTALFILSMVGFTANSTEEALGRRITTLSSLKVTTSAKDSETQLEAAKRLLKPQTASAPQLNPQDKQYIRNMSRQLAKSVRGETSWPHSETDLRYELAKEQIRRETILAATIGKDDVSPYPQELSNFEQSTLRADALVEEIEKRVTKEAVETPGFLDKIRNWAARYQEPAGIDDLRSFFVEQVTDSLFDVLPKTSNPLTTKAIDVVTGPMKKSASDMLQTAVNHLMIDVIKEVPPDQAWSAINSDDSALAVFAPAELEKLNSVYPTSAVQAQWAKTILDNRTAQLSMEDREISSNVKEALSKVPTRFATKNQLKLAELVSTYESEFPLDNKTYNRDRVFSVISEIRKKKEAQGLHEDTVADNNSVDVRLSRSKDFEALRNYSRVGGVLIGRSSSKGGPLAIKDVEWSRTDDDRITISLVNADGSAVSIGRFRPELINAALAYVLDGRLAAVTLLNAQLIERDQVMMHPALRDSILGMQFGRADEWIFQFLDPDPPAPSPNGLRQSLASLYAATHLYDKALNLAQSGQDDFTEGRFVRLQAATDGAAFQTIAGMKGFDPQLVAIVSSCMSDAHTEAEFSSCIADKRQDSAWVKKVKQLSTPRTGFVSQIYERPYDLEPTLRFLRNDNSTDGLWPLAFTVQMTVNDKEHATLPQFDDPQKEAESTHIVLEGIHEIGEYELLQRLQEFTVLQRLFRAALNGQLGDGFPVSKLPQLARDTHSAASSCSTPRWVHRSNLSGESTEKAIAIYLQELPPPGNFEQRLPAPLAAEARRRAKACAVVLNSSDADGISSSRIEEVCSLIGDPTLLAKECSENPTNKTEACVFLETRSAISSLVAIHKIRESLNAVNVSAHIDSKCP